MPVSFSHLPRLVLAIATINGLSTDPVRFPPSAVVPPYGQSVNGTGGVVSGAGSQPALRCDGAFGSVGGPA